MRRSVLSVVLAGVALTGCSNFATSSRPTDVAAEAGAVQLPAQRLADMVAGVTAAAPARDPGDGGLHHRHVGGLRPPRRRWR